MLFFCLLYRNIFLQRNDRNVIVSFLLTNLNFPGTHRHMRIDITEDEVTSPAINSTWIDIGLYILFIKSSVLSSTLFLFSHLTTFFFFVITLYVSSVNEKSKVYDLLQVIQNISFGQVQRKSQWRKKKKKKETITK